MTVLGRANRIVATAPLRRRSPPLHFSEWRHAP